MNRNVNLVIFNMSKITFVALRRFIYPPGRWERFGAIGYWVLVMGNWLLAIGSECSSAAIPAFNLSSLTSNLSTRLSSDEQRPPRLPQQQTATSPKLRQQGIGQIDHPYRLLRRQDFGG